MTWHNLNIVKPILNSTISVTAMFTDNAEELKTKVQPLGNIVFQLSPAKFTMLNILLHISTASVLNYIKEHGSYWSLKDFLFYFLRVFSK